MGERETRSTSLSVKQHLELVSECPNQVIEDQAIYLYTFARKTSALVLLKLANGSG